MNLAIVAIRFTNTHVHDVLLTVNLCRSCPQDTAVVRYRLAPSCHIDIATVCSVIREMLGLIVLNGSLTLVRIEELTDT